ncbi:NlpC/P60 family protein [Amedibacillus sp. YH-ame10]
MNFIERNTKKVALIVCVATAASGVTTVFAAQNAEGWHGTGSQKVFIAEGKEKVNSWVFDENGAYYVNASGHPITSAWKVINGAKYYFNADGVKVSGTQIINGKRYYFQKDGVLPQGWNKTNDSYYNEFGEKLTGVQTIDGETYNFGDAGKLQQGWATVDGKEVYFSNGALATGEIEIDGQKYNFNDDGTITKGWKQIGEEKAYCDDYGNMIHGWKEIDGKKYYFNKQGFAATDTEYAGYKFDADGVATEIEETETTTSRGGSNGSSSSSSANLPSAKGGIAGAALAQVGVFQDCTALASNSLAAVGINFHGWPADYLSLGSVTSNPQPGDLIYYPGHIAVYIGNGQAVHGGYLGNQTVVASVYISGTPTYIRVGG